MIVSYAITKRFTTKSENLQINHKDIFEIKLENGYQKTTVGPGDSFTVNTVISNDATEEMYVFVVVEQPTCNSESLYTYVVNTDYKCVYNTADKQVYAYAASEMTVLYTGESTSALTTKMTMRSITNAEYAGIDDLNVRVTGYAIGIEGVSTVPAEAWEQCKAIGNISE